MLRGVLRCSACGRRYFTSTWSGKTPRYRHAAGTGCALDFSLSQEPTERSVREAVAAALSNPDLLRAGVQRYEDARGATDVELRSRVAHVQKQIEKIRRDERRLIGLAVADGEQRAVVEGKLRDLAQRRGALAGDLRAAEAAVAEHAVQSDAGRIERLCARARRGLAALDADGWRALGRETVDEVRVTADRQLEIRGLLTEAAATAPADRGAGETSPPYSSSPSRPPGEMGRAC
jgi:hypothetical protein